MSKKPVRYKRKPNRQISPGRRAEIAIATKRRIAENQVYRDEHAETERKREEETLSSSFRLNKPYPEELLKPLHVDEFLDEVKYTGDHPELNYVHFMLTYFRMPAVDKLSALAFMKNFKLFTTYEGRRWRVNGASRLGDVYLTKDFEQDTGYEQRVELDFSKLTQWHHTP